MIRVSIGTAIELGIAKGKNDIPPTTAYIMIGNRCNNKCSFCSQSMESSSRKDKLSRMFNKYVETGKKPIDMFFIEETYNNERKLLSVLNLNNMIPVCDSAIINYNISQDKDYFLLRKEIEFCNIHKEKIISDSKRIYNAVTTHSWQSLENRCCNFKLLEEKCIYYQSQNI